MSAGVHDFRTAAGLPRDWAAEVEALTADGDERPGLRERARRAGRAGAAFVNSATFGLGLQAAGLLYVTFSAQYQFILAQKGPGEQIASMIQALSLDSGMVIFSFLALGLAKQGKPARVDRALIVVCSLLSAGMNYAAARSDSWRSVAVYVIAPVFLAVITDRVIAGIRRHVLGDDEPSVWAGFGRSARRAGLFAGMALLYLLRFALAPPSTWTGLRRWVLDTARVPEARNKPAAAALTLAPAAGALPAEAVLAIRHFAGHVAAGTAPNIREAKAALGVGQEPAAAVVSWVKTLGSAVTDTAVAAP